MAGTDIYDISGGTREKGVIFRVYAGNKLGFIPRDATALYTTIMSGAPTAQILSCQFKWLVMRPCVTFFLLFGCFFCAQPVNAEILWQSSHELHVKNNGAGEDILRGAVKPHDDSSSGTLYFKMQIDPQTDLVHEVETQQPYRAGLAFYQGDVEKLGVGNAWDAWGYSAFCASLNFPSNKPGELTLQTNNPEQAGRYRYLAPRRGVRTTIVIKVDYVPHGNDLVTVWLSPELGIGATEKSQQEAIVTRFKADASFDQIRLVHKGSGEGWKFRDIAIATSFEDFVPQPWWQRGWIVGLVALTAVGLVATLAVTLERLRTRKQIRAMEREQAVTAERVRIAQDLHDELGAKVTEIVLLGELAKTVQGDPEEKKSQVESIVGELRQLHASLDEVVWSINPRHDSLTDLVDFISEHAERFTRHAPAELHMEVSKNLPSVALSSVTRHHFLLAVKEALHNAVRHANAKTIRLWFGVEQGNQFVVRVSDDGCGIAEPMGPSGDGLQNMRARLEGIGGMTEIHSAPGQGTEIVFRLPLS